MFLMPHHSLTNVVLYLYTIIILIQYSMIDRYCSNFIYVSKQILALYMLIEATDDEFIVLIFLDKGEVQENFLLTFLDQVMKMKSLK